MKFNTNDYPIVFLSYDEPNCEENYQHLLTLCPDAKRVHGVKGSDTAHKECAKIAQSGRIIIIDGDNHVRPDFFNTEFELECDDDNVISFSGCNNINDTQYGNGGIKCWNVDILKNMRTHENAGNGSLQVDFDYHTYLEVNQVGSDVVVNGSPLQAWRSGFREGVKLSLAQDIDWRNYDRLWRWMHLGLDVENGIYAIHGARFGVFMTKFENWQEYDQIKDFDFLNNMFNKLIDSDTDLLTHSNRIGLLLKHKLEDHRITDVYSAEDSINYKNTIKNPVRGHEIFMVNKVKPEYDIVFIHSNEPGYKENLEKIKSRFPRVKELSGVEGIHQAHIASAKLCGTDYFWVVDGDADIVDDFDFTYDINFYEQPTVRVFRAINPVNKLVYGHGGIKLLPRIATLQMDLFNIDMTTSISKLYEPVNIVSNIHKFNTDGFNAWRTAFRECVKLSSQVIHRQISEETLQRLMTWCTVGENEEYGKETIRGALMGKRYGERYKDNRVELKLINNYAWLKRMYDEQL